MDLILCEVWSEIDNLKCVRHLIRSSAIENLKLDYKIRLVMLHTCTTYFKLPPIICVSYYKIIKILLTFCFRVCPFTVVPKVPRECFWIIIINPKIGYTLYSIHYVQEFLYQYLLYYRCIKIDKTSWTSSMKL